MFAERDAFGRFALAVPGPGGGNWANNISQFAIHENQPQDRKSSDFRNGIAFTSLLRFLVQNSIAETAFFQAVSTTS